jgi:outer membrane receptor protein involved in Fe transport
MQAKEIKSVRLGLSVLAALCLISPRVFAQAKDASVEAKKEKEKEKEDVVLLTPFVVEDADGENAYRATSTLAGTRVRTNLNDVASAITVVTSKFMKDTGVTSNQGLLLYTPSTEVSGMGGNFTGLAGVKIPNEVTSLINPSSNNRIRGLSAADNTRDYFLTDIPWDSFNVGRIDLQRGPNSILFGVGSPAGIINASVNDAAYKRSYQYELTVDQFGSLRNTVDINQVVLKNQLAFRVSLLDDKQKYQQEPAFNNQRRLFAAARYDANLLGEGNHTTVRVKFENGQVRSNNPRILPPNDRITPWFDSTYKKSTVSTLVPGFSTLNLDKYPLYAPGGIYSFQGVTSGPDAKYFFGDYSNQPTKVIVGAPNTSYGQLGGPGQAYRALAIPSYSNYALGVLPGGSFYQDKVLTDSTVFNFFDNLLDGPNKREWQNWRATNADLQQTFFGGKLALDLTYDRQTYDNGQVQWLAAQNYAIGVDINSTLPDGSANANLGRPYVASTDAYGNFSTAIDRQSKRAIATLDLDSKDLFGKNIVSRFLGRNVSPA